MILIVGCGRLGGSLAARLASRGVRVTVLDQNSSNLDLNLPPGFQGRVVLGLEIDTDVLQRAGIREAEAVATLGRDESTNIMAAEVARQIFQVPRVVIRIDQPRLAELYRQEGYEVISPILEGTQALENSLLPQEGP